MTKSSFPSSLNPAHLDHEARRIHGVALSAIPGISALDHRRLPQ